MSPGSTSLCNVRYGYRSRRAPSRPGGVGGVGWGGGGRWVVLVVVVVGGRGAKRERERKRVRHTQSLELEKRQRNPGPDQESEKPIKSGAVVDTREGRPLARANRTGWGSMPASDCYSQRLGRDRVEYTGMG